MVAWHAAIARAACGIDSVIGIVGRRRHRGAGDTRWPMCIHSHTCSAAAIMAEHVWLTVKACHCSPRYRLRAFAHWWVVPCS